jgi:hypothetical protein
MPIRRQYTSVYFTIPKAHKSIPKSNIQIVYKENTGIFSTFRGDIALRIAALLSLSKDPKALLGKTLGEDGVLTATLSTSVVNTILAQQAAMIAAITASSAAAAPP